MNACDTILFDFGHTLVDLRASNDALKQVYAQIRGYLLSIGQSVLPSADDMVTTVAVEFDRLINDSYLGPSLEELDILDVFDQAYRKVGIVIPQSHLRDIVIMEHSALSAAMIPADQAKETLLALKGRGLKLGLVSNMTNLPEMMLRDLERMALLDLFDVTIFSSQTGIRKPDPRIYQAALSGLEAEASKTIFVGDRIKEDVRGPQALGMRAVLSHQFRQENPNGCRPDRVILNLSEILDYLKIVSSI